MATRRPSPTLAEHCDIDYAGVGHGNYEAPYLIVPPMEIEPGHGVAFAARAKRAAPDLAILAEGRINRPEIGERGPRRGRLRPRGDDARAASSTRSCRVARARARASGSASASATTSASPAASASTRWPACRTRRGPRGRDRRPAADLRAARASSSSARASQASRPRASRPSAATASTVLERGRRPAGRCG